MKINIAICSAFLFLTGSPPALAQELTTSECKEILETYGTLPSSCPTTNSGNRTAKANTAHASLQEPTSKMRQNNVFFPQGGVSLTSQSINQLERLAEVLDSPAMARACIKLIGHSDSSGGAAVNVEIGNKRAEAVRNQLALLLKNPARIEALSSEGEARPLEGLPPESSWQRRVEVWARDCDYS